MKSALDLGHPVPLPPALQPSPTLAGSVSMSLGAQQPPLPKVTGRSPWEL